MAKNIKTLLCISFASLCFFSCKKNKNAKILYGQIVLATPVIVGDSVKLSWSALNNDSLGSYTLVRVLDTTNDSQSTTSVLLDKNTLQYTDTLSLAPYVQYYVTAQFSSLTTPQIVSNKEVCNGRTDINFIYISPKDALYDRNNNIIYLYSASGNIAMYDVQNKKCIKQIATNVAIGYCDIGTYNGKKELYVPRSDGWLYIYDATTLVQIDQIQVGFQLFNMAYNNGVLFICGMIYDNFDYSIVSYNRATKSYVSKTDFFIDNDSRIKLIPNSNSEFFAVGQDGVYDYKFDSVGNYVSYEHSDFSNYNFGPSIFEVFPDGSNFVNSAYGNIIDSTLTYVTALPLGKAFFTSFDFDNSSHVIYAGLGNKTIQSYSTINYQINKTINTIGYPMKVFYNNGSVISVSITTFVPLIPYLYSSDYFAYAFVEQF